MKELDWKGGLLLTRTVQFKRKRVWLEKGGWIEQVEVVIEQIWQDKLYQRKKDFFIKINFVAMFA